MTGAGRSAPDVQRRYAIALDLLHGYGFEAEAPVHLPRGLVTFGDPRLGAWHLRGVPRIPGDSYIEVSEISDTRLSYPFPSLSYAYFVHLDCGDSPNRNISFHKDPAKPPELRYHWHEYRDGERRSDPTPTNPVTLRWFLEAAWELLAEPDLGVPELLQRSPPPGPQDPY